VKALRRASSALAALVLTLAALPIAAGPAEANVVVGSGYSSSYSGESAFMAQPAGGSGQFSAVFFNDGSQLWQPGVVGLLVCLPDKVTCNVPSPNAAYASKWFSTTVYTTVTALVPPGSNGFFIYNFQVPANTPPATTATFNGEVGLIGVGAVLRPQGYFQSNATPLPTSQLSISPPSAAVPVGGQVQFASPIIAAWTVIGGCGAITPTGLFAAAAANAPSQPCKVVATSAGMTVSASVIVYGPAASIACTSDKPNLPADGVSVAIVSATLKDSNGNVVANATTPAITFTNITPTLDAIYPSGPQTPSAGVASITLTAGLTAGVMQVTATTPALLGCNIQISSAQAGNATQTAASFLTNPVAADGTTNSILEVDLRDATGTRVIFDNTTTIYATRAPASASICSITGVGSIGNLALHGRVDFPVTVTSIPGTCTFSITTDNLSISGSQATLTTQIVGAASRLGVAGSDSPKAAGGASSISITVDVQDARGLRVTSSFALVSIQFDLATCTGAPGGSAYASGGTTVSATQGRAIFRVSSLGSYAACALTITAPGLTATNAAVRFDPAAPDHLSCAFVPTAIRNDGIAVSTATVRVRDANNNYVTTGGPYSITFVRTTGSSTMLLTGNPVATVAGVATFNVQSTPNVGLDAYTATITTGTMPTLVNASSITACVLSVSTNP
jgi:hypothetical protein